MIGGKEGDGDDVERLRERYERVSGEWVEWVRGRMVKGREIF